MDRKRLDDAPRQRRTEPFGPLLGPPRYGVQSAVVARPARRPGRDEVASSSPGTHAALSRTGPAGARLPVADVGPTGSTVAHGVAPGVFGAGPGEAAVRVT